MKKNICKRTVAAGVAFCMVAVSMAGCGKTRQEKGKRNKEERETVTLNVYQPFASFSGLQGGYLADILKEKFGVKLNIMPSGGSMGDISDVFAGKSGDCPDLAGIDDDQFGRLAKEGALYDWQKDGLLKKEGTYIREHFTDALEEGKEKAGISDGKSSGSIYGISGYQWTKETDHSAFNYTWDIRYDLYRKSGYPKVEDLEDYAKLLIDMQNMGEKDDKGKKAYAISLNADFDQDDSGVIFPVTQLIGAYYGYFADGMGYYDKQTGDFYDVLAQDGPYLIALRFYHKLYQAGALDPASKTQKYEELEKKAANGSILFSFTGGLGTGKYNDADVTRPNYVEGTDSEKRKRKEHLQAGKMMYSIAPQKASPAVWATGTVTKQMYVINAKTEHPELCMRILDYFYTPEGQMVLEYGPKGVTWDYDKTGHTYFTDLGKKWQNADYDVEIGHGYTGTFNDGANQTLFYAYQNDASNPDADGEPFNCYRWDSNIPEKETEMEKDWQKFTGCRWAQEYFENRTKADGSKNYVVCRSGDLPDLIPEKTEELWRTWKKVGKIIKKDSWNAIYADSETEFEKILQGMKKEAGEAGYEKCVSWSLETLKENAKQ